MSFQVKDDLSFERLENGDVRISFGGKDTVMDYAIWASVIAQMSYYGEEDYGWYRALNFHLGQPVPATCPLVEKVPVASR